MRFRSASVSADGCDLLMRAYSSSACVKLVTFHSTGAPDDPQPSGFLDEPASTVAEVVLPLREHVPLVYAANDQFQPFVHATLQRPPGPHPRNSDGKRKEHMELLATVPLLIIDDLGMRKLGPTAEEELLEIVMRRYERASTLLTSNRPVEDWGKLLGDSAAVTAMLDRLLHHGHIIKCGPRSWRTKTDLPDQEKAG